MYDESRFVLAPRFQPIDSRLKKPDADFIAFLSGMILGFAAALLLVAFAWHFGEIEFSRAEQPLAPVQLERERNRNGVPATPRNIRSW